MGDVHMRDSPHENGADEEPPFSEEEREILDLYDQAQSLELEFALTKARVRLAGDYFPQIHDSQSGANSQQMTAPSRAGEERVMEMCQILRRSRKPGSSFSRPWLSTTSATRW